MALVLLLNYAQTVESVRQFLSILGVHRANSFLDAIQNRGTRISYSVGELGRVKFDHC